MNTQVNYHHQDGSVKSVAVSRTPVAHPVEVLAFRKGVRSATVVTDGIRTKSFEWEHSQDHENLKQAIAYLEAQGYTIDNDNTTW